MDIICDTNIWYDEVMKNVVLPEEYRLIVPILVIEELSITDKIDNKLNLVKEVYKVMMKKKHKSTNVIVNPSLPFFYFHEIENPNPPVSEKANAFLEFTSRLANDLDSTGFIQDTRDFRLNRNNEYKGLVQTINDMASSIRAKIKDRDAHKKIDATEDNKQVIQDWVLNITGKPLSPEFNWSSVELFISVMGVFFKRLELGDQMALNDTFDFFMLSYVQPGAKYWTNDIKWNKLIIEAGMEKYIYTPKASEA